MFDFDAGKLLIIGVVALIVIGPKDLPRVLRQVGQMVGKLRRMASEFQGQFMDAMKEADLQDLRDEVAKIKSTADLNVQFDPARDIQRELTEAVSTPLPAPATSDYAVPAPEHDPVAPDHTAAATGLAPALPEPEALPLETAGTQTASKRKIVLKRRHSLSPTPVDVRSVQTRFRNVKQRRQELEQ